MLLYIVTLGLYRLCNSSQVVAEDLYHNIIFRGFRLLYDNTLGWLPIPFLYLLIPLLLAFIFVKIRSFRNRSANKRSLFVQIFAFLIGLVLSLLSLFYWFWGFNYARPSIETKLEFEKIAVDESELFQDLHEALQFANALRNDLTSDTWAYICREKPSQYESQIRSRLEGVLGDLQYKTFGKPRVRMLSPKGTLLHWSTAGVYLPFVFEGHVDAGLHPITWPFTMAHEMTHGYGVTDEGECNFIAHLVCISSKKAELQYSGWIGYLRYLMANARMLNPERYKELYPTINQGILNDLKEIYAYSDAYKEYLPALRDLIYDQYLKSHGVREGLQSYSRIIDLKLAWKIWVENQEK